MGLIDKLVSIADSVRAKTGGTDPLTLDEMATAIDGIETGGGGDTTIEDGLITGTLPEYTNDRVESVGQYALGYLNVESVNLPSVTECEPNAFSRCTMKSVNLPNLTTAGSNAFYNCNYLQTVNLPSLTGMKESTDSSLFYGCINLTRACLPLYAGNLNQTFYGCIVLKELDIGNVYTFYTNGLKNCKMLKVIIIRKESVASISKINCFDGTPFAEGGTGGWCLVTRARIEEYQNATNWSSLYAAGTCTFLPLEDYTVDGTTTGELDWDKIERVTG